MRFFKDAMLSKFYKKYYEDEVDKNIRLSNAIAVVLRKPREKGRIILASKDIENIQSLSGMT